MIRCPHYSAAGEARRIRERILPAQSEGAKGMDGDIEAVGYRKLCIDIEGIEEYTNYS